MLTIEEAKRRLIQLQNHLTVINLFEKDFSFSKEEKEKAIDVILDEMIGILKQIRNHDKNE
jgi:hypothetical protein